MYQSLLGLSFDDRDSKNHLCLEKSVLQGCAELHPQDLPGQMYG